MNIYISNLPADFKNEDLKKLFMPHGEVTTAEIAMDVFTDRSRGFGYVEMPHEVDANQAIASLDQTEIGEFRISVEEAKPKDVRKGSYKVGSGAIKGYQFKKN